MVEYRMKEMGLTPVYYEEPTKFPPYWFEENDYNVNRVWIREQLPKCLGICLVYFLFVILGPRFMKDRKPFDLQFPLTIWNFSFALFSFIAVFRTFPAFIHVLSTPNGFHNSACVHVITNQPATFYGFLFTLSKVLELGDTVFIVLRKKPLLFLHWFHHMTMVYVSFFVYSEGEPFSGWPAIINCSVHAIMYTYYGIMSMKIKLPKQLAMTITIIQLLQFATVLAVNVYGVVVLANGGECQRTSASIRVHAIVVSMYAMLFLRYFYTTYIVKQKSKNN